MYSLIAAVVFAVYATIAFKNLKTARLLEDQLDSIEPFETEISKTSIKAIFRRMLWLTIMVVLVLMLILVVRFS
jgi:hypothetical protein